MSLMKYLPGLLISLFLTQVAAAQDSLRHRLIFIGDMITSDRDDSELMRQVAEQVVNGRTSVFFFDESPYLRGKADSGSATAERIRELLKRQYQPMRNKGARVYFITGSHRWNRSGREAGKIELLRQSLLDTSVKVFAGTNCPDPRVLNVTDSTVIVFFNSEWWLFPQNNNTSEEECECKTKAEVLARLDEIRYNNSHKQIVLVSHHPFQSYGTHDGKYTFKDHLFPLTALHKDLFIPLPVAGTVYSFFRSAFSSPNDAKHALHKSMVNNISDIFKDFPNLVHVAGHEEGLQLIKGRSFQVITGREAKRVRPKKGGGSVYADNGQGYVVADIVTGNRLVFNVYRRKKDNLSAALTYRHLYTSVPEPPMASDSTILADSATVSIRPSYDEKSKLHRWLFGENYRKEWAAPTTLPYIYLSRFKGGLKPLQRGGGMQSQSLRLSDKNGTEWVIRSVEKSPDALLLPDLRQTFARDWLDDATSAQHPFSALVVPPVANAVNVPHAVPVIGVIAPDKSLGVYGRVFSNMIALVEEREPLGESDNTAKMKRKLQEDNDNEIDAKEFLNARMLDLLLGDWDRHEDQWRWKDVSKSKDEKYLGIPRDRDQVFHLTQGVIPKLASRDYILPTLRNFDPRIRHVEWVLFKTRFVNAYPSFQFSREQWSKQAEKFRQAVTDSVLEAALRRLPRSSYEIRHQELLKKFKARRDRIPVAMDNYYRFIQKVVDIQATDKHEWISVTGEPGGDMRVVIRKINKDGEVKGELMNKVYDAKLTKEIRLYVRNGNDSVFVNNPTSSIKLRLIGGKGKKTYQVSEAKRRIHLYDRPNGSDYLGNTTRFKKHIADDSLNTAFAPVNLYNVWMPVTLFGLNIDDGFIIGTGFRFTRQEGFRKSPYAGLQQLQVAYAFSTGAYRVRYTGEWIRAIGKADLVLNALARAPNNTLNFFGRGNETVYNKTGDFKRFYRTRYSTYHVEPSVRWRSPAGSSISLGPSLYYYAFDSEDNKGRFIENASFIGSYDSLTVDKSKTHLGAAAVWTRDKRNSRVFPQWGSYINIRVHAYKGMGDYAKSFGQIVSELAFYKSLNARSTIVLAERMGGVASVGNAAFYQSAFLGGHENLLGYRQYRLAGHHSFYNNFELRIKLADIASYIIPGQFGILGFWDVGRVWEKHDNSGKWHHGKGGGIYFAPASVLALSFVVGHSSEGLYPYFTMGLRF